MLFDIIECSILDWVKNGGFPQGEFEEFQRAAYEGLRNDPTQAVTFRDETPRSEQCTLNGRLAPFSVRQEIIPFQANSIVSIFQSINKRAFEEIRTEAKEQILNVNESQYIEHILAKFRLDVPEIFESQKTVASVEQTVEVEGVTFGYEPSAGARVRRFFCV